MQRLLLASRAAAAATAAANDGAAPPRRQPIRKGRASFSAPAAAAAAPQAPLTVLERLGRGDPSSPQPLATAVEPPSSPSREAAEADSLASPSPSPSPPTPPEKNDDEERAPLPPPQPPKPKGASFYANVGTAVRTIREDLPALFQRDMDFSIYRDDVVFRDPRNAFHGIKNYRTIFWSVRFHGNLFFTNLRVDVSRVWQPEPREIRVRWSARGESRLPWRPVGVFDGISTFRLDEEGMIYVHEVNNVVLRPPPGMRSPLSPLFARLNLVPELDGVVQGVPTGGGGACPGWVGERQDGRWVAPLSSVSSLEAEVEERRRRGSLGPSPSLLLSPSSSAAAEESVLVIGHEPSYSYLTSLSSWRRRTRREGKGEKEKEDAASCSLLVGA